MNRIIAAAAIICMSPLMLIVALAIRILDGAPVLYRQPRVGYRRQLMTIVKFRTMVPDADRLIGRGVSRLTRTGPILRKTGLDELPQLISIVRGDMSFVGPRAVLPEVAANIPATYESRFSVMPGITGLAQVSGRNELLWSRRLQLDAKYADERDWKLDTRIILRTLAVLVSGRGHVSDRNTEVVDDLGLLAAKEDDEE